MLATAIAALKGLHCWTALTAAAGLVLALNEGSPSCVALAAAALLRSLHLQLNLPAGLADAVQALTDQAAKDTNAAK